MNEDGKVVFGIEIDTSGAESGLRNMASFLGGIAKVATGAILGVAAGIGVLSSKGVEYNAQMEQYTASFETMLGSTELAEAKLAELKEYAANTPFEFPGLAKATQTLLAFNVSNERTTRAIEMIGDISQGNQDKLNGLALVFGQVASTGKLMGQDLMQMINQGFNPLTIIAQKTGASVGDLKKVMSGEKASKDFQKMIKDAQVEVKNLGDGASDSAKMLAQIGTDGVISAEIVEQAMEIATSKGGLFYGAMEKQSKTFTGRLSTLKDDASAFIGEITVSLTDGLSDSVLPLASGYIERLSAAFRSGGIEKLVASVGAMFGDLAGRAAEYAPKIIDMAVNVISSLVYGLKNNASKIAAGLSSMFLTGVKGLVQSAPEFLDAMITMAIALVDSLSEELPEMLPKIVETLVNGIVRLVDKLPELIEAGVSIVKALAIGLIKAAPILLEGLGRVFASLLFGVRDNTQDIYTYVNNKTVEMRNRFGEVTESLTTLKQTLSESLLTGAATEEEAMTLLDQLEAYSKLEFPTKEDTANAQAATAALVGMYEGLGDKVGKDGLFSEELTTIRELIVTYAREAEALAYRNYLVGLYQERLEARKALAVAQEEYDSEKKVLEEQQARLGVLEALQAKMELVNDTPQDWNSPEAIQRVKDLAIAYQQAGGDLAALGIDPGDLGEGAYDEFIALYDQLEGKDIPKLDLDIESQQALLGAMINGEGGIASIQTLIGTLSGDINEANQNVNELNSGAVTVTPVIANIDGAETEEQAKKSRTANIGNRIDGLGAKATAAKEKVVAELAQIDSDSDDAVTKAGTIGEEIDKEIAGGVSSKNKTTAAVGNAVVSGINAGKRAASSASSIGSQIGDGIASGLNGQAARLNGIMREIVRGMLRAAAAVVGNPGTLGRETETASTPKAGVVASQETAYLSRLAASGGIQLDGYYSLPVLQTQAPVAQERPSISVVQHITISDTADPLGIAKMVRKQVENSLEVYR